MSFPIIIETSDDHFSATLLGVPELRVVERTRVEAILALQSKIEQRVELGELLSLDIGTVSVSSLAGRYSDDPTLQEISDSAYQERDVDRDS